MHARAQAYALSQLDAFFVAYQERAGISMQLGAEVEIEGELQRASLARTLEHLVERCPRLGQTLHRRLTGMSWRGECLPDRMLRTATVESAITRWRNVPLDPFREPPFQLLWIRGEGRSKLAFRAHHAALDGESFFAVCADALRILARVHDGGDGAPLPRSALATGTKLKDLVSPFRLMRQGKLTGLWNYTRWLATEAKAGRSATIAMRAREPGDIALCERLLDADALKRVRQRAASIPVAPAWLCAAAWIRAINAWNASKGAASNSLVSLEVPVSLRRRRSGRNSVGNFISPLLLFSDASQPLERVAVELAAQIKRGLRQHSYMGMPLFTAPARFLPWPLFRRLAVNTTSTGFATSHFIWLEQKFDIGREMEALSGGRLRLSDYHIYTSVCLHMGAALAVIAGDEEAKLSLTYRLTALSGEDAETLLDLAVAELSTGSKAGHEAV